MQKTFKFFILNKLHVSPNKCTHIFSNICKNNYSNVNQNNNNTNDEIDIKTQFCPRLEQNQAYFPNKEKKRNNDTLAHGAEIVETRNKLKL